MYLGQALFVSFLLKSGVGVFEPGRLSRFPSFSFYRFIVLSLSRLASFNSLSFIRDNMGTTQTNTKSFNMYIKTYSRTYAESLFPAGTLLVCVPGGYLAVFGVQP